MLKIVTLNSSTVISKIDFLRVNHTVFDPVTRCWWKLAMLCKKSKTARLTEIQIDRHTESKKGFHLFVWTVMDPTGYLSTVKFAKYRIILRFYTTSLYWIWKNCRNYASDCNYKYNHYGVQLNSFNLLTKFTVGLFVLSAVVRLGGQSQPADHCRQMVFRTSREGQPLVMVFHYHFNYFSFLPAVNFTVILWILYKTVIARTVYPS
jgi:hypothetical protein